MTMAGYIVGRTGAGGTLLADVYWHDPYRQM